MLWPEPVVTAHGQRQGPEQISPHSSDEFWTLQRSESPAARRIPPTEQLCGASLCYLARYRAGRVHPPPPLPTKVPCMRKGIGGMRVTWSGRVDGAQPSFAARLQWWDEHGRVELAQACEERDRHGEFQVVQGSGFQGPGSSPSGATSADGGILDGRARSPPASEWPVTMTSQIAAPRSDDALER